MNETVLYNMSFDRGKRNNFLYYGLLFYLFLFYSQIAARIPALTPLRIEFIFGTILFIASLSKFVSREVQLSENKMNVAAVLFIFFSLLLIPLAYVKTRSLDMFIHLIKFFAIYLFIVTAIHDERRLKGVIYVYMGMIALLFVEPFLMSIQGKGFVYNNHMMRLAGVTNYFGHPNQLGSITAMNLPFFYYLMLYERSKALKVVFFALILMGLWVIMLTQSRTGFVGVLVFGLCLFFLSKRKVMSLFIIILSATVLWFVAPDETKARFLTMRNIDKVVTTQEAVFSGDETRALGSMASRWELIRRGFIIFIDNPVFGVGPGCFISYQGNHWGYWFPPHNTYIQALAEMGILGFAVFMFVLFTIYRNIRATHRILISKGFGHSFLGASTMALMVHMIVLLAVTFFGQDLYENYWWLAGGLSVVILRIVKSRAVEEKPEVVLS